MLKMSHFLEGGGGGGGVGRKKKDTLALIPLPG